MTDDAAELRQYAREGSEEAFARLVARYLPLVYSAALRQVGEDEQLAKDIAQAVFIALAHKAGSLCRREFIMGWLYTTTRNIAVKAVRGDRRRQAREQAAAAMQELHSHPADEAEWREVGPLLDEAMACLGQTDRNAVLLRFFQGKDLKTVGATLGISEDAARMRVNRALESLRGWLRQRGVVVSAAVLGTALASETIGAVPVGLAATITSTAVASAAATGGAAASILKVLLMTKLKIGIVSAVIVAGVVTPWVIQRQVQNKLREENQALRVRAEQVDSLLVENSRLSNLVAQAETLAPAREDAPAELLRLRGEVGRLRQQESEFKKLQTDNRRLQKAAASTGAAEHPNTEDLNIQLPKDAWAFAGYDTPEAALQTVMWARREGDLKSLMTSLSPAFIEKAQKAWGDKFEDEIKSELPGNLDRTTECRILKKEMVSDSEAKLFYALVEKPQAFGDGEMRTKSLGCGVTARRVGQEWKLEP